MSNAGTNAVRSPSYPNMSLAEAVAEVRKIEEQYRTAAVDREVGAKIIGYSSLSGPANKALAALAQYGLVERAGKGQMRVSDRARAILHPTDEHERNENLRWAAGEPTLFRDLNERFQGIAPPEEGVITHLKRQGFNNTAIRPATKAYLGTLLYLREVGASESHGTEKPNAQNAEQKGGDTVTYGGARKGDWVNYESGGAIANPKPMRVRHVDDEGWVFVDGSETGLEMDQVIVVEPPEEAKPNLLKPDRPTLPLSETEPKPGARKAIFPLREGDVALIFPENITARGLQELGMYLKIFLKNEEEDAAKKQ